MFSDDDLLPIASLQHLTFCERQWSLVHLEQTWSYNVLTIEGKQLHEFVHELSSESRSGVRMVCALRLRSLELGLTGVADLVEFHQSDDGVAVEGLKGLWLPFPVEYKRGRKRYDIADEMQLCAQALCLEEMLGVQIGSGAIYYGQPRRRTNIELNETLRAKVSSLCARARELIEFRAVPAVNIGRHCKNCSLMEECMPGVVSKDKSESYLSGILTDIEKENGGLI